MIPGTRHFVSTTPTDTGSGGPGAGADAPTDIPAAGWKQIALRVKDEIRDDHVTLTASGVAFHAFLATVPLLAAAIAIYGMVSDASDVSRLVERLSGTVPDDVVGLIQSQLDSIVTAGNGQLGFALVIGIATGLWSASSGMSNLMEGLNIAYDEDADDRPFWEKRGIAMLLTLLFVAFLGVAGTVVTLALGVTGAAGTVIQVVAWLAVAVLLMAVLAVIYRYGPDREDPEWEWVSPGAVFAVVAWVIASFVFAFYVANFGSYNETYGSLGAVVITLLWLFLTSILVVVGAELNTEIERQTREDTTTGVDEPMGERGAHAADSPPD